jgi:hypothetical protein
METLLEFEDFPGHRVAVMLFKDVSNAKYVGPRAVPARSGSAAAKRVPASRYAGSSGRLSCQAASPWTRR